MDEDLEHEEMMFRVMFNTAFIRSNILILNGDEIDTLWNARDHFPMDFRAEVGTNSIVYFEKQHFVLFKMNEIVFSPSLKYQFSIVFYSSEPSICML